MHGSPPPAGAMPALQWPTQLAGSAAALPRCGPAGAVGRSPLDRLALQHPPVLPGRLAVGELSDSVKRRQQAPAAGRAAGAIVGKPPAAGSDGGSPVLRAFGALAAHARSVSTARR